MNLDDVRSGLLSNMCRSSSPGRKPSHYITYRGETHSVKRWAEITGIKLKTLYDRLNREWPIEKVFQREIGPNHLYLVVCEDGITRSLGEAADHLGIPRNTVYSRIRRGQTPEQSLAEKRVTIDELRSRKRRQLDDHYQNLVRHLGQLRRDGEPIPDSWFVALDDCLDAIWAIRDEIEMQDAAGDIGA